MKRRRSRQLLKSLGELTYKCSLCPLAYTRRSDAKLHIEKKHGILVDEQSDHLVVFEPPTPPPRPVPLELEEPQPKVRQEIIEIPSDSSSEENRGRSLSSPSSSPQLTPPPPPYDKAYYRGELVWVWHLPRDHPKFNSFTLSDSSENEEPPVEHDIVTNTK